MLQKIIQKVETMGSKHILGITCLPQFAAGFVVLFPACLYFAASCFGEFGPVLDYTLEAQEAVRAGSLVGGHYLPEHQVLHFQTRLLLHQVLLGLYLKFIRLYIIIGESI